VKPCNQCGETKPLTDFYKNTGYRCKVCHKAAVKLRSRTNPAVQEYKRQFSKRPEVRARHAIFAKRWKDLNPVARKAQNKVSNSIRDGKLTRKPCSICGGTAHAHHPDYSKPLDVVWLCPLHHQRLHADEAI
jgi:lipopolysaccharide biosynthesis regulator YciM